MILALIAIWVAIDVAVLVALNRWRAGTHAAMRARVPDGVDEHAALRELADTVLGGIGDRSTNDLTYREWMHLARALRDMPVLHQAAEARQNVSAAVDAVDGTATAGASGGVDRPAPDAPIQSAAAVVPPSAAAAESADPDPAIERAVYGAALAHGLIKPGMSDEAAWTEIDDVASSVFGKDPAVITNAEWATFAAEIAAGVHDPAPARPRAVTP